MKRRAIGLLAMGRSVKSSIRKIPANETYYVAYHLYNLIDNVEGLQADGEELKTLIFKMAEGMNKGEELEELLDELVAELAEKGKLTIVKDGEAIREQGSPYKMKNRQSSLKFYMEADDEEEESSGYKYTHYFDYDGILKYTFREDAKISRAFRSWETPNESDVNFCRCAYVGGKEALCSILKTLFLTDKREKSLTVRISSRIKKIATSLTPVQFLKDSLQLSDQEAQLLLLAYKVRQIKELWGICSSLLDDFTWYDIYSYFLDVQSKDVQKMLKLDGKLVSFGFMDTDGDVEDDAINCIASGTLETFFSDILKEHSTQDAFPLESYAISDKSTEISIALLSSEYPVNILLYGVSGSGKTEYAKSLAQKCGLKAFVFKNDSELDNAKGVNSICRLNCLLSLAKKDSVIIVDEADTMLETQLSMMNFLLNHGNSSPKKGTVNRMLENSVNKVIWIVNHTSQLETSTRRRFTYSIKFNEMSESTLKSIAATKLEYIELDDTVREKVIDLCGRYRVTGASIDNMVKTLKSLDMSDSEKVIDDVQEVLEANSRLLHGKAKMRERVGAEYNTDILNCSVSADKIVSMITNALKFSEKNKTAQNGIRLLFYGASGTGKTEFARYIAEKLHKKILLKRASDIMSKYVGENEHNIKEAFEEAEQTGEILLFDEADSFFADRNAASTSWERTLVNEFLTQMEEFSGILICTTNLRKIMDTAAQRRFHIITEFKPLTKDGIKVLLNRFFSQFTFIDEDIERITRYDSVTPGDFGTLASKIRFMDENDVSAKYIINELCNLQKEKESGGRKIGF